MRFQVLIHGSHLKIADQDGEEIVGFYTSEVVDAPDSKTAVERVRTKVRVKLLRRLSLDQVEQASLAIESVERVGWWHRRMSPDTGLVFYGPESESA